MAWVLLLNSNECRIFSFSKKDHKLDLIKEVHHPENKSKDKDIVSDHPGHYSTDNGGGGSYVQRTDPRDVKIDQFVLEVSHLLEEGRVHNKYDDLIVIASPKIHGQLTHHLNKNVEKLVSKVIQKDLLFLKQHELLDFLTKGEYTQRK